MIDCSVTDSQQQWTPLVSGANPALTIRPWMSELKARHKRRTAKKRKDELRRAISSKQATASMLEEASIVVSPRQNDLNVFDFDDEMMWQPLQTSNPAQQTPSLAASALASSQSTAAPTSSSFATIASKTADETLQEQIQEQRRQQTGNKGRSKSKIVLMSSSSGGRRI